MPIIQRGYNQPNEQVTQWGPMRQPPLARLPENQPPNLPGISVYHDSETDVELLLARDGQSVTIRAGHDRLELSAKEWRGLYSGVLNIGPGRATS